MVAAAVMNNLLFILIISLDLELTPYVVSSRNPPKAWHRSAISQKVNSEKCAETRHRWAVWVTLYAREASIDNWFQVSALETTELQAPPAVPQVLALSVLCDARRSLGSSAFPGRARDREINTVAMN